MTASGTGGSAEDAQMRRPTWGPVPCFIVDMNMLRGDYINASPDFMHEGDGLTVDPGDLVYALDEDGERYLARVESVSDKWLRLWLDFKTRRSIVTGYACEHTTLTGPGIWSAAHGDCRMTPVLAVTP